MKSVVIAVKSYSRKICLASFMALAISNPLMASNASNESGNFRELNPVKDSVNYFFIEPISNVLKFFQHSLDDAAEEAVKFATMYLAYSKSPLSRCSNLKKAAAFPIVYLIANELGDRVGDWFEPVSSAPVDSREDFIGHYVNDLAEDLFKVGCYSVNFAGGFAPTMLAANCLLTHGAPRSVVKGFTTYAYFSAITKSLSDVNHCTSLGHAYGNWAQETWTNLTQSETLCPAVHEDTPSI